MGGFSFDRFGSSAPMDCAQSGEGKEGINSQLVLNNLPTPRCQQHDW